MAEALADSMPLPSDDAAAVAQLTDTLSLTLARASLPADVYAGHVSDLLAAVQVVVKQGNAAAPAPAEQPPRLLDTEEYAAALDAAREGDSESEADREEHGDDAQSFSSNDRVSVHSGGQHDRDTYASDSGEHSDGSDDDDSL
jgi:hypothetical protein